MSPVAYQEYKYEDSLYQGENVRLHEALSAERRPDTLVWCCYVRQLHSVVQ